MLKRNNPTGYIIFQNITNDLSIQLAPLYPALKQEGKKEQGMTPTGTDFSC